MTTDHPQADPLACVRTGDWLDSQTFPALAWSVPGIIPEGFGLLIGAPKLGKSWMALHLGLALSTGSQAFGAIDTGGPRAILYLALEDGERRLQDRCRKLLAGAPIPALFHYATRVQQGSVFATVTAWLDEHEGEDALVILDTLGKVMPPAAPGESAYARDYRVGSALKSLSDRHPGSTVLVVHHTRKAEGADWMDSTSGTQGLNGSADFTVALGRSRNETEAVLRVTGRDVRENEFAMTSEDGHWALVGKSLSEAAHTALAIKATAGLGDTSTRVVSYVTGQSEGARASDVAAALGISEKDAGTYLLRAERSGRISRLDRGLYGPVGSVGSVGTGGVTSYTSDTSYTSCTGCGLPLDPFLADAGQAVHVGCEVAR